MSETITTIIARLAKTTENYAVYESADEALTGMYVSLEAFDGDPLDFAEVLVTDGGDGRAVSKVKDTSNYGRYSDEAGAINGMYVDHDLLGSEETDSGFEAPDSINVGITPSDEEAFEATVEEEEEEAEADEEEGESLEEAADELLVGGDSDEGDDTDEAEADDSDEEVEVSDEELEVPGQ